MYKLPRRVRNIVAKEIGHAAMAHILYGGKTIEEFLKKEIFYEIRGGRMFSSTKSEENAISWAEMCEEVRETASVFPENSSVHEINAAWPQAKQKLESLGFRTDRYK